MENETTPSKPKSTWVFLFSEQRPTWCNMSEDYFLLVKHWFISDFTIFQSSFISPEIRASLAPHLDEFEGLLRGLCSRSSPLSSASLPFSPLIPLELVRTISFIPVYSAVASCTISLFPQIISKLSEGQKSYVMIIFRFSIVLEQYAIFPQ